MSDKRYFYDDKGNYVGHTESSYQGGGDIPLWGPFLIIGLISIFVGIFGGIVAMLKFAFWACLIAGGFILAGYLVGMVIFKIVFALMALNEFLNKKTNDHATVIWSIIAVVIILLIVNGIHNWLFN